MKFLVTGHGSFATGLCNAYELIAGKNEDLISLEFYEEASLKEYEEQIAQCIADYQEEGLIVLTDLKGGTPFNISMIHSEEMETVCVLAGTNLPMLLEGMLTKDIYNNATELAQALEGSGRKNIEFVSLDTSEEKSKNQDSDGI